MLLVAPLLIFNGLFTAPLPPGLHHDKGVPSSLLLAENALRVLVFVAPLWLGLVFVAVHTVHGFMAHRNLSSPRIKRNLNCVPQGSL